MAWEIFERAAPSYEEWYATSPGNRADEAEGELLSWLLRPFPGAQRILDIGCGTGHFTERVAQHYPLVVGLDRASAMLKVLHQRLPATPAILGDAHQLPIRTGAVDVTIFVTTLEFLEYPQLALSEAVRVAHRGVVLLVLNRWSVGGFSRRWGAQARRPLLGQARDYSLPALRAAVQQAAGERLQAVRWASTLFPLGLWNVRAPIPMGDILGMAAKLAAASVHVPTSITGNTMERSYVDYD